MLRQFSVGPLMVRFGYALLLWVRFADPLWWRSGRVAPSRAKRCWLSGATDHMTWRLSRTPLVEGQSSDWSTVADFQLGKRVPRAKNTVHHRTTNFHFHTTPQLSKHDGRTAPCFWWRVFQHVTTLLPSGALASRISDLSQSWKKSPSLPIASVIHPSAVDDCTLAAPRHRAGRGLTMCVICDAHPMSRASTPSTACEMCDARRYINHSVPALYRYSTRWCCATNHT